MKLSLITFALDANGPARFSRSAERPSEYLTPEPEQITIKRFRDLGAPDFLENHEVLRRRVRALRTRGRLGQNKYILFIKKIYYLFELII